MAFGFYTEHDLTHMGIRKVGKNIIISKTADLVGIENMEFGDNIVIEGFCILAALGDTPMRIGSHVHINTHCLLSGVAGITIEDCSTLSSGCKLFSSSDDYSGQTMTNATVDDQFKAMQRGSIHIGAHCVVGANSVIMPSVTLGTGAAIGALSFVNDDCTPWGIYAGTPAKRIKARSQELLKLEPKFLKWYEESAR